MISKNKRLVTGTISEIYTNVPETKQSLNNAKTATVKYEVDNKIYFDSDYITLP